MIVPRGGRRHTVEAMRALCFFLLAGCGLPELTSEDVFGRDPNPKAWVYGTVTDARTRGPIAAATVQLARTSATTDDNGAFRLEGLTVGDNGLAVSKQGYQALGQAVRIHAGGNRLEAQLVPVSCGVCGGGEVCDPFAVKCVQPATISGDIVDACNGAALLARITVGGVSACTLEAKGYWQIEGVMPGGPQTLAAGRPGYQPFTTQVTLKSGFNVLEKISLERVGGCAVTPAQWLCQ